MKQPSWSYSHYGTSQTCWRQLWYTKHAPAGVKIKFVSNAAAEEGTRVHAILEERIKSRKPLKHIDFIGGTEAAAVDAARKLKKFCAGVDALGAKENVLVLTEHDIVFKQDWSGTHWKDWDGAWLRTSLDVFIISADGTRAFIWDWKNGNSRYAEDMQLRLYCLAAFKKYPKIQSIRAGFYFVQTGEKVIVTVTRDRMKSIEQYFFDNFLDERDDLLENTRDPWPATANADWKCKWCDAKDKCSESRA